MPKIPRISGVHRELTTPETNLWRAVLLVAVQDAMGIVYGISEDKKKTRMGKKQAIEDAVNFFAHYPQHLEAICMAADVTASKARASILEAVKVRWGDDPETAIKECDVSTLSKKGLVTMAETLGWDATAINALVSSQRHGCSIV